MIKRTLVVMMVLLLVMLSFSAVAMAGPGQGAELDRENNELRLPEPANENTPEHTPASNNPIEVAGY